MVIKPQMLKLMISVCSSPPMEYSKASIQAEGASNIVRSLVYLGREANGAS